MASVVPVGELPEEGEVARLLAPEVRRWFLDTFGAFTPPQLYAVRHLHAGENVLVSAPTGSGKTLSAFLAAINELAEMAAEGTLADAVHVVYVSPLKALNNDIARNLEAPLAGIEASYRDAGEEPPPIRVGVRTGDTTPAERQKMTRTPPHILITTPESLAILLNAPKFREHLARVRWIIVDEVHALVDGKRGVHLALTLERLSALVAAAHPRGPDEAPVEPVRIGLSATVSPLDEVARFLFGDRAGRMVDTQGMDKAYDLQVATPVADLVAATDEELQTGLYDLLDRLIDAHRSTLIFTNTRSGTERVVFHLRQRFGDKYAEIAPPDDSIDAAEATDPEGDAPDGGFIAAHHGSMSRERRLDVEERLKAGDLKCVVTSTSLELGIDIGYVDLVVLLGSPRGIARTLQRVGRSGHRLGATSKGVLVALDRDELVECAVLAKRARARDLDDLRLPHGCLDVLAQHILGLALEGGWTVETAHQLVKRAHPYRDLSDADMEAVVRHLAAPPEALQTKRVYPRIRVDDETGELIPRGRLVRPTYYMNVGTIPETSRAKVFEGDRYVGEVEEDFLEGLVGGDVFTLGGATYAFQYARGMKAQVRSAPARSPTVPQWYSESLGLTRGLAEGVGDLRAAIARRLDAEGIEDVVQWAADDLGIHHDLARTIVGYVEEQRVFASVPYEGEILVEEFVDDDLRRNYVFHLPMGRATNEALARAFASHLGKEKKVSVRVLVSDYGFALLVPRKVILSMNDVKGLFFVNLEPVLTRALGNSELLKRRFRHVAQRSLLVLRNYAGRTRTTGQMQVDSFVLFHMLQRHDRRHPVLREVYREVFQDALDLPAAEEVCFEVVTRKRPFTLVRGLKAPTPFAFNVLAAGAGGGVMNEDRRAIIRDLHEKVELILEMERKEG